jgi:hypothetical protein
MHGQHHGDVATRAQAKGTNRTLPRSTRSVVSTNRVTEGVPGPVVHYIRPVSPGEKTLILRHKRRCSRVLRRPVPSSPVNDQNEKSSFQHVLRCVAGRHADPELGHGTKGDPTSRVDTGRPAQGLVAASTERHEDQTRLGRARLIERNSNETIMLSCSTTESDPVGELAHGSAVSQAHFTRRMAGRTHRGRVSGSVHGAPDHRCRDAGHQDRQRDQCNGRGA